MGSQKADAYLETTQDLARRIYKGRKHPDVLIENIYKAPYKSKKQRWHDLTLDDKASILYDVVVFKLKHKDVAQKYLRSQGYISMLVKKMKSNPNFIEELIAKKQ